MMSEQFKTSGQVLALLRAEGMYLAPATLEYWIRSGALQSPQKMGHIRMWAVSDIEKVRELIRVRLHKTSSAS